jgi:hypothetical protein
LASFGSEELLNRLLSAAQERSFFRKRFEFSQVLDEANATDIKMLLERAARLPQPQADLLRAPLLERWFELDPSAAADWIRANPREYFWEVPAIWGHTAPESALAEALAHPEFRYAGELIAAAVYAEVGKDSAAVAAKLAALPADPNRDKVLRGTVVEWAKKSPLAALEFIRQQPQGKLKQSMMDGALREWAERDPVNASAAVTQYLAEIAGTPPAISLAGAVASHFGAKDPEAALEWIQKLPADCRSPETFITAASSWAKTDPLSALDWCVANGVDPNYAGTPMPSRWPTHSVLSAAMSSDPMKTLDWIQSQPDAQLRSRMVETALCSNSRLTASPASAENVQLVTGLLGQLPADAQESTAYQIGGDSQNRGKLEDVQIWANTLPDEITRAAAIEAAVRYRAGGNPDDAGTFAKAFPEGYQRDAALRGIAASQEPNVAIETAMMISDPETRSLVVDLTIARWVARSPSKAQAWLNAHAAESSSPAR